IELRLLSPVSRVPYFLLPNEGLAPLAMDMSPTYVGYKFRSLALANCPPISHLSGCGGFFQNVVGVSIAYKIFGRRVRRSSAKNFRLAMG
ncbi:MAG: hypothetical protein J6J97_06930, partial [Akkermansia sp.]|nr:hypothetical protein [Akkermansia sp.]